MLAGRAGWACWLAVLGHCAGLPRGLDGSLGCLATLLALHCLVDHAACFQNYPSRSEEVEIS